MTLDRNIELITGIEHRLWIYPPPPIPATARENIRNDIDGASPHSMVPVPVLLRSANLQDENG